VEPSSTTVPTSAPANALAIPGQRFVARQPIFDRAQHVFGYELLFRNGLEDYFHSDPDMAARSTVDSSLLFGLNTLCDGRRAFINCTRESLLKDLITLLPANQTVVEILETVEPDDLVIAACQRLREAGYMIALDDFVVHDPRESLCDFADIVKIDIQQTTRGDCEAMVRQYGARKCRMLAEKVETQLEFRQAFEAGFTYFQGYFFRHPELLMAHEVPANRIHYLRLLEVICRPELDLRDLESLIKQETSVCYRLLRYLNSPLFGFAREIRTVRHAMTILGERELRRWIRLVITVGAAEQKCSELILMALARARFCELISKKVKTENDLFLLGLLSMMDTILEIRMDSMLEQLPVDREIKAVLLGRPSEHRPLFQLMLALESGEWQQVSELSKQLRVPEEEATQMWWQSMRWAQQVSSES
jgi:EAL and modified HD-GYP domain-containing signal transduction protein